MFYTLFLFGCSEGHIAAPLSTREDVVEVAPITTPNESSPPINRDDCPADYPIKGNIRSEKIFHVPGGRYYNVTDPEECFSTVPAAISAGYRQSKR